MVTEGGKRLLSVVGVVVAIITGLVAVLCSPEAVTSIFGEWGCRHLVSTDAKIRMINERLADPDFPLIMVPGSRWSAGVHYAEEML